MGLDGGDEVVGPGVREARQDELPAEGEVAGGVAGAVAEEGVEGALAVAVIALNLGEAGEEAVEKGPGKGGRVGHVGRARGG